MFSFRPDQIPDLLLLCRPNPDSHPSTHRFRRVLLDPSVPISGSDFQFVLLMVAFSYTTVKGKILTIVHYCFFWMYTPPLYSKKWETNSPHHPGNERQWSVNDFWSCILGNQSGDWLRTVINGVLATFIGKRGSDRLPAPSSKSTSTEHQRFHVSQLG